MIYLKYEYYKGGSLGALVLHDDDDDDDDDDVFLVSRPGWHT